MGAGEFLLRAHYLCSPLLGNLAFLVILFLPFDTALSSPWLPIAALPYYVLYTRDLQRAGYGALDLARVYTLTVLLVPVNLAGVARSIRQIVTGRKSAFDRTPKVAGRTAVAAVHVLMQGAILVAACASCLTNLVAERYAYAMFSALNAAFLIYGITTMIGWAEAFEDVHRPLQQRIRSIWRVAEAARPWHVPGTSELANPVPVARDARRVPDREAD